VAVPQPLLTLSHISHHFDSAPVLDDVTLTVHAGEVHALLGENGAGKTTLMRIASGGLRPAAGTVERLASVAMVHQHFTSIPAFTVAENLALAAGWHASGRRLIARAREVIARVGLPLDAEARVEGLSVQLRQRLEIAQALATTARVLLLDEPTAVLAPREVAELLPMVRQLAADGAAIVLISHKLPEVLEVADTVTVLRQGRVTAHGPMAAESAATLSRAMIGGALPTAARPAQSTTTGAVRVRLAPPVGAAPITLHAGELVGLAAIEGNGQRELLRTMAGQETLPGVSVQGTVGLIPEDRGTEGLIGGFSLTENLLLAEVRGGPAWLDWPALAARTGELLAAWDVRGGSPSSSARSLSGGNQQKFVLGRTLVRDPELVVAVDPTRGLDVAATQAIHDRLRAAAQTGACVVVHASDLDEVMVLADRLLVMHDGVVRELPRDSPRAAVGDAMLGLLG
jgi:simple sugar transport system ATP-binding protein